MAYQKNPKRPANCSVRAYGNETLDDLLKRFKRKVKKNKILETCRMREYYLTPKEYKKLKSRLFDPKK